MKASTCLNKTQNDVGSKAFAWDALAREKTAYARGGLRVSPSIHVIISHHYLLLHGMH